MEYSIASTRAIIVSIFFCFSLSNVVNAVNYTIISNSSASWSWYQAKLYCQNEFGTSLASWTNNSEYEELLSLRNIEGDASLDTWVGVNDVNNAHTYGLSGLSLQWSDGSEDFADLVVNTVQFAPREPVCGRVLADTSDSDADLVFLDSCFDPQLSQFACNTPQNDTWRLVLAYNSSVNVSSFWADGERSFPGYNDDLIYVNGLTDLTDIVYRSLIIDDWNYWLRVGVFSEVKLALVDSNSQEQAYFIFEATPDPFNITHTWFSNSSYIDSSYSDVLASLSTRRGENKTFSDFEVFFESGTKTFGWLQGLRFSIATDSNDVPVFCELSDTSLSSECVDAAALVVYINGSPLRTTEAPTYTPTAAPTLAPTVAPSHSPTKAPTHAPTKPPTGAPTQPPTDAPTHAPVWSPTGAPTQPPTRAPTVPPSAAPTESPTESPTDVPTSLEFLEARQIEIEYESLTAKLTGEDSDGTKNYLFNPGYRQLMYAFTEVELETSEQNALFDEWFNNDTTSWADLEFEVLWTVSEKDTGNVLITRTGTGDSNNNATIIDTAVFTETRLVFDSDGSIGYFYIDAWFAIYNDKRGMSLLDKSICDGFDDSVFTGGEEYRFEVTISFGYQGQVTTKTADWILMKANNPPRGGTCSIVTNSGNTTFLLDEQIGVLCDGWVDPEGKVFYNFLFGESFFLQSNFTENNYVETYLPEGIHGVTAVVIDDLKLATCVFTNEVVVENPDDADKVTSKSLCDPFLDYGLVYNDSDYRDGEFGISRTGMVSLIFYEILNENEANLADLISVECHETIFDFIFNNSLLYDVHISQFDAATLLTLLSIVTSPVISTDRQITPSALYNESIIASAMKVLGKSAILPIANSSDFIGINAVRNNLNSIANLLDVRYVSNESSSAADSNGDEIAWNIPFVNRLLLGDQIPNQDETNADDNSFRFISDNNLLDMKAVKVAQISYDECQIENNVQLSERYISLKTKNGLNLADCTIMSTFENIYEFENSEKYRLLDENYTRLQNKDFVPSSDWQTNFILLHVTSYDDIRENEIDTCDSIVLSFNMTQDSVESGIFGTNYTNNWYPQCAFYEESMSGYDITGCYLLDIELENNTITCACNHTTYFGVSWTDFEPQVNYLSSDERKQITWDNIQKYPLGWIVCLVWILFCCILICLFSWPYQIVKNLRDIPLIANQGAVLAHITHKPESIEEISKYRSIKEMIIVKGPIKWPETNELGLGPDQQPPTKSPSEEWQAPSAIVTVFALWKSHIRNDHIWLGLCFRDYGTNFNQGQRVSMLMLRFLTSTMIAALFYGLTADSRVGDYSLMFYQALFAFIPMFAMEHFMKKHKPTSKEQFENEYKLAQKMDLQVMQLDAVTSVSRSVSATSPRSGPAPAGAGGGVSPAPMLVLDNSSAQGSVNQDEISLQAMGSVATFRNNTYRSNTYRRPREDTTEMLKDVDNSGLFKVLKKQTLRGTMGEIPDTPVGDETDGNVSEIVVVDDEKKEAQDGSISDASAAVGATTPRKKRKTTDAVEEDASNLHEELTKLEIASELSARIMAKQYKYAYCCRQWLFVIVVLWAVGCAVVTTSFCVLFDVELITTNGFEQMVSSQCDYTDTDTRVDVDIRYDDRINFEYSESEMLRFREETVGSYYTPYNPPSNDNFDSNLNDSENMTTSMRFIISVISSYLIGIIIYGPLIAVLKAIRKYKSIKKIPNDWDFEQFETRDLNKEIDEAKLFYFYHSLVKTVDNAIKNQTYVGTNGVDDANMAGEDEEDDQKSDANALGLVMLDEPELEIDEKDNMQPPKSGAVLEMDGNPIEIDPMDMKRGISTNENEENGENGDDGEMPELASQERALEVQAVPQPAGDEDVLELAIENKDVSIANAADDKVSKEPENEAESDPAAAPEAFSKAAPDAEGADDVAQVPKADDEKAEQDSAPKADSNHEPAQVKDAMKSQDKVEVQDDNEAPKGDKQVSEASQQAQNKDDKTDVVQQESKVNGNGTD